jgi:hypothetical protein
MDINNSESNTSESNNIIYYQLEGGFMDRIIAWNNKRKEKKEQKDQAIKISSDEAIRISTNKVSDNIKINNARIDINQAGNIAKFFAHVLTQCKNLKLTLENIKNIEFLGAGSFGYTFKVKDKVIKIILCKNDSKESIESIQLIQNEIDIHQRIMLSPHKKYFIKMFGYVKKKDNTDNYIYYDIESSKSAKPSEKCKLENKDNSCTTYVFMEAGTGDLRKFIKEQGENFIKGPPTSDSSDIAHRKSFVLKNFLTIQKFTDKIYDLLNFYKISGYFLLKNKKIFIHNDIKLENIIYIEKNDDDYELKIIDFGLSSLSLDFFVKNNSGTEKYYCYYHEKKEITKNCIESSRKSPFFDIFSLIMCYIEVILGMYDIKLFYNFQKNIKSCLDKINIYSTNQEVQDNLEQLKIKIYKLFCIGWIFNKTDFYMSNIHINNTIINSTSIQTEKKIDYQKFTSTTYYMMEKIITSIYACKTIEELLNITYNNITFNSFINKN